MIVIHSMPQFKDSKIKFYKQKECSQSLLFYRPNQREWIDAKTLSRKPSDELVHMILNVVCLIPAGQVATYGQVAHLAG